MDRPENELVSNAIGKYENEDIFSVISPYFLQLKHRCITYNKCRNVQRQQAVGSLMVVENGAIGFARMIFLIPGKHEAWTRGAAFAQIG
jgi:hypothetical protein